MLLEVQSGLRRKVDLGPFKKTVDDGLPSRHAAFVAVESLVTNGVILTSEMVEQVAKGCGDSEGDIKLLSHSILSKLIRSSPSRVDIVMPTLTPLLIRGLKKNAREGTVDTDHQRAHAILVSTVKLVACMDGVIKGADKLVEVACGKDPAKKIWDGLTRAELS